MVKGIKNKSCICNFVGYLSDFPALSMQEFYETIEKKTTHTTLPCGSSVGLSIALPCIKAGLKGPSLNGTFKS